MLLNPACKGGVGEGGGRAVGRGEINFNTIATYTICKRVKDPIYKTDYQLSLNKTDN